MGLAVSIIVIFAAIVVVIGKIADKNAKEYSKHITPMTGGQLIRGTIVALSSFLLPLLPSGYLTYHIDELDGYVLLVLSFVLIVVYIIVGTIIEKKLHMGNLIGGHCLAYIRAERSGNKLKTFLLALPAIIFWIAVIFMSQGWTSYEIKKDIIIFLYNIGYFKS